MTLQIYNKNNINIQKFKNKEQNQIIKNKRKTKEHEQKQATRSMIANKEQEDIANNTKN